MRKKGPKVFKLKDAVKWLGTDQSYAGKTVKTNDIGIVAALIGNDLKVEFSCGLEIITHNKSFELVSANPCSEIDMGMMLPEGIGAAAFDYMKRDKLGGAIKKHTELKPCTCDSLELFRKGCRCGAIVKQKWGLQG